MRSHVAAAALAFLCACGGDDDTSAGASDAGSGRACTTGLDQAHPTAISSPSLDCSSRTCLHVEGTAPDQCTAACDDESDCVDSTASACEAGYACVAPMDVGPFACTRVCVCNDRVPSGGFPVACAR